MSDNQKQGEDFINIKEILGLFLSRWYWFVISLIVCLAVAVTYIAITPPTYTRTASVLIKNSNNGRSATAGMEPLADMGLFKTNTDVKSEVYILKSPSIMTEVVSRLKLDYNYSLKYKNVRFVDLYNATPVMVELDSTISNALLSFTIKLLPDKYITLSDFNINGIDSDLTIKGKLSQEIKTPYGKITIIPTAIYPSNYIDESIYFSKSKPSVIAAGYSERLNVSVGEDDVPIILFSFVDVSARRAEDILNTLDRKSVV